MFKYCAPCYLQSHDFRSLNIGSGEVLVLFPVRLVSPVRENRLCQAGDLGRLGRAVIHALA